MRIHGVFVGSLIFLCIFSSFNAQAQRTSRARIISERVGNASTPTGIEQLKVNKKNLKSMLMLISSVDRSCSPMQLFQNIVALREANISSDMRVRLVLMVAAAERTARFMKAALLKSLDSINAHIIYWRSLGNRFMSYYLHLSPFKLFSNKSRYQDIGGKVKRLTKLQKKYFIFLGQLNDQLNHFNAQAEVEQQLSWVCELVAIMQKMPCVKSKREVKSTLGGVMNCLQDVLCRLPRYKDRLAYDIGEAAMPGFVTIKNTLIASTILGVSWYLYKHPEVILETERKIITAGRSFYEDNVEGPFTRIKKALWGKGINTSKRGEIDDIADQLRESLNRLTSKRRVIRDDLGASARAGISEREKSRFVGTYCKVVGSYLEAKNRKKGWFGNTPGMLSDAELTAIRNSAESFDIGPVRNIYLEILATMNDQGLWGKTDSVGVLLPVLLLFIETLEQRAIRFGKDVAGPIEQVIEVFKRIADQSQLTAAILALIPTGLAAWAGFSLVKKLVICLLSREGYNFRFTRFVLHDLHHLLNINANKFMEDMDFESHGKLLFYVHQLKRDAYDHVRYDQKHRFLGDIRALASPNISTTQKLETIHGIWNTYTFLKPGFRLKPA